MTTKELIRAEIRKWQSNIEARCPESTMSRDYTKEEWDAIYEYNAYTRLLSFLDTLPDEPITTCNELEEAAENPYVLNDVSHAAFEYERTRNDLDARSDNEVVRRAFIAGAEWMKRKMISALKNDGELPIEFIDKFHEIDRNAFQNGQKNMKEQMMEVAVEGLICATITGTNAISFLSPLPKELTAGSEVRIIILPKEEEQ